MGTYIARRLLLMIPTLVGITFLVFMLIALSPGGIGAALQFSAGGGREASKAAQQQAYLEDRYGLNDPVVVQYVRWLGRISPIKFGAREQLSPSGELERRPKALREPPLLDWWGGTAPPPVKAPVLTELEGATPEQLVEAYRQAKFEYAGARLAYIGAVANLETELRRYATAAGLKGAVDKDRKIVERGFRREDPDRSLPQWQAVVDAGNTALATMAEAQVARARLAAIFDLKPYPEAGLPIVPGYMSVSWPDFGVSFSRGRPVIDLIKDALPVTLLLNLLAFPIIYLVAIPGGMLAATRRGTWVDVTLGGAFVALWSIPTVVAGVLAMGYLASPKGLGLFPVTGLHDKAAANYTFLPTWGASGFEMGWLLDLLWHLCLPVACLVYTGFAVLSKQTRAAMLDNLNADYVRTAKAKGVPRRQVILQHVFRNSLLPLITMFVALFPATLSGSVVVERIFTVPGMGSLIIEAINLRDRELILANTFMIATVNLLALLLADILYALADPRVTYD